MQPIKTAICMANVCWGANPTLKSVIISLSSPALCSQGKFNNLVPTASGVCHKPGITIGQILWLWWGSDHTDHLLDGTFHSTSLENRQTSHFMRCSLILTDQRRPPTQADAPEHSHLSGHARSTWLANCWVNFIRWPGPHMQKCLSPHLSNIFSTSLELLCNCYYALMYKYLPDK